MNPGKITCDVLKKIRSEIAAANQIEYQSEPCSFKGACTGTCPKCESELQYLEHQLIKKHGSQKTALLAGVSLAIMTGFSSCNNTSEPKSPVLTSDHSVSLQSSLKDSVPFKPVDSLTFVAQKPTHPVLKIYKNQVLIFEEKNDTVDFLSDTLTLDQISFQGTYAVRSSLQGAIGVIIEMEKIACLKHARFNHDGQNLKEYLNQYLKIPSDSIFGELTLNVIVSISESGNVNYVNVEDIQRTEIQNQIKELFLNMPNWIPALDFKGKQVDSHSLLKLTITSNNIKVKTRKQICLKKISKK